MAVYQPAVALNMFGDGSDGAVTFDGSATILGIAPVANTYTLTRDIFCTNVTVNNGITVIPNGFCIFYSGTLTGSGIISAVGANGSSSTGGASVAATGSLRVAAGGGGNGRNTTGTGSAGSGSGGNNVTGASGGAGGTAGGANTGGAGNSTSTPSGYLTTAGDIRSLNFFVTRRLIQSSGTAPLTASCGGGGGGGGCDVTVGTATSGGGGAAALGVYICGFKNAFTGTITAKGGDGAAAVAAGGGIAGGGGGGSGGYICDYSHIRLTTPTYSVAGGSGGAGAGGGTTGTSGGSGKLVQWTGLAM